MRDKETGGVQSATRGQENEGLGGGAIRTREERGEKKQRRRRGGATCAGSSDMVDERERLRLKKTKRISEGRKRCGGLGVRWSATKHNPPPKERAKIQPRLNHNHPNFYAVSVRCTTW